MLRSIVVCVVVGCGRLHFDPLDDAGAVGTIPDVAILDTAVAAVRCDWTNGPTLAYAPVPVTALQGAGAEFDPALVPGDPHTMYFASARDAGSHDLFYSHRAALDTNWDSPTKLTELNTPNADEAALVVDAGALHGYYSSELNPPAIFFEIARANTGDPFAQVRELTELEDGMDLYDPWPSPDELELRFTRGSSLSQLEHARRAATGMPWVDDGVPTPYSTPGAVQQTLTADQLLVVWSAPGMTAQSIFYAIRTTPTDAFGPAQLLAVTVPGGLALFEPYVRDDGCELHFTAGSDVLDAHMYEVQFVP